MAPWAELLCNRITTPVLTVVGTEVTRMLVDRNPLVCNNTLSTISTPIGAVFYDNTTSLGHYYVKTGPLTFAASINCQSRYGVGVGFKFDQTTMGPGGLGVGDIWFANKSYGSTYFSVPLELPMRGSDGGDASHGLFFGGHWYNGPNAGRWASNLYLPPSNTSNSNIGARCGLPVSY